MTVFFADAEPRTLIDELLAEQQRLTAVERFAQRHERRPLPAQARYYRELIPLEKPQPGEQYAFAVDLDACTGCKACVSACHSLNGLDDDEIWRNVGLIHGGSTAAPYQQTITTACHHCVEPACLEGCPVCAYEKDEVTGIVRHLDDQCIGCQYCVLKCPYDVPKYSAKKGIVRKCDMCQSRLAANEAPACVQACPTSAISIRVVSKSAISGTAKAGERLVPGSFDSDYTAPTTSYRTRKNMPANARPGDAAALRLEHAHWPLIWMLVLTQISAGMFVGAAVLVVMAPGVFALAKGPLSATAFATLNVGLALSVLHLGRPLGAWRAFLGLRTSWMSREIVAFGAFAGVAAAFTGAAWWPQAVAFLPMLGKVERWVRPAEFASPLAVATAALAVLGVFCSAMIYVDTRRAFWSAPFVFTKFFGTVLLLGSAGCAVVLAWLGAEMAVDFAVAATLIRTALFGWEAMNLRDGLADPREPNHRSQQTIWKLCRPLVFTQVALFFAATSFGLPVIAGGGTSAAICATVAFVLTCAAQTIERYFFFTAVVAPRMPGGVAA
jgi:Fe-S-cluster-containing dehydrogenase component/DMSO reductase anchor subunit